MPSFAETSDVEQRLGRTLKSADPDEGSMVELLLEAVADEILDALSRDEDWYDALDDDKITRTLKFVSVEAIYRVLDNPSAVESLSESLGAYSYTKDFRESAVSNGGLYLTDAEGRRLRKAVFGKNTASPQVPTTIDEWYPVTEDDVIGSG